MNPRKLAAIDIALLGSKFIIAEFAGGVLLSLALGAFILLRGGSFWQSALGLYFVSLGVNYVPMLIYALAITRNKSARAELGDELNDRTGAMSKCRRQSILLLVPLLVPIVALHRLPLRSEVASVTNFCVLVVLLLSFPLVLRWTGALAVAEISPQSVQHTQAFLRFCFVPTLFLWICFAIVLAGIRRHSRISWRELVGVRWHRWQAVLRDLGIASATLIAMVVIGNLSNALVGRSQQGSATFRWMVAQNTVEALAFLCAALTAGFVEEFVFRGYLQRQLQALCGNTLLASALQIIIFTSGHFYQGWIRLVPVFLIGTILTVVALWRRSLVPGMIAHGLGDGLVAFSFFAKHL
jgi:membrane protease YdiL (CAAX protease family)